MSTTVQLRIDPAVKNKAVKILNDLGLDLSSAIKLFLSQVIRSRSIPFEIRTVNGMTPRREREILKESAWARKHGKRYTNVKEMIDDILA